MRAVDLAAVHAVEHLERMHHRPADQIVDPEPPAAHVVDALDVVLGHLVEDVGLAPRALHLEGDGLRPAHLRHRHGAEGCGAGGDRAGLQEPAARDGLRIAAHSFLLLECVLKALNGPTRRTLFFLVAYHVPCRQGNGRFCPWFTVIRPHGGGHNPKSRCGKPRAAPQVERRLRCPQIDEAARVEEMRGVPQARLWATPRHGLRRRRR